MAQKNNKGILEYLNRHKKGILIGTAITVTAAAASGLTAAKWWDDLNHYEPGNKWEQYYADPRWAPSDLVKKGLDSQLAVELPMARLQSKNGTHGDYGSFDGEKVGRIMQKNYAEHKLEKIKNKVKITLKEDLPYLPIAGVLFLAIGAWRAKKKGQSQNAWINPPIAPSPQGKSSPVNQISRNGKSITTCNPPVAPPPAAKTRPKPNNPQKTP